MQMPGQAQQVMGKKVGGKMSVGQYYGIVKQYYMWLVIAAVVAAGLTLVGWIFVSYLVQLYGAFVLFWFGYQLAKQKKGEMKDVLIGGALLGLVPSLIMGIGSFIYFGFIFAPISLFGVGLGGFGVGFGITQLLTTVIGGAIGGLVLSLIGYAVAGGFNKAGAAQS